MDDTSDVWHMVVQHVIMSNVAAYDTACSLQATSKSTRLTCHNLLYEKLDALSSKHNLWFVFRTPRGCVDVFGSGANYKAVEDTVLHIKQSWSLHNTRVVIPYKVDLDQLKGKGCRLILYLEQWWLPSVGSYYCNFCSKHILSGTQTVCSLVMRHRHLRRTKKKRHRYELVPYLVSY